MRNAFPFIAVLIAATTASAHPLASSGQLNFKNSLLDWHVGWSAEVTAIPALLASIRDPALRNKRELLKTAASDRAARKKQGYPFNAYDSSVEVATVGSTARLLSLTQNVSEFTGGAHPNHGTSAILWDRRLNKAVAFYSLFSGGSASVTALLHKKYCMALDKERARRRGPDEQLATATADDPFKQCPKFFSELALIPMGKTRQALTTVTVHADPYVAGPYVEGDYDVSMPVTSAMLAALKPQYRASFAPGR